MKKLMDYVAEAATLEEEVIPWDMEEVLEGVATPQILDIREPYEFDWKLDCAAGTITKYRVRQDGDDPVIEANADKYFTRQVREDQFKPKKT